MMDDYNLFRQQVDKVLSQQKAMRLQLRNGLYSTTCTTLLTTLFMLVDVLISDAIVILVIRCNFISFGQMLFVMLCLYKRFSQFWTLPRHSKVVTTAYVSFGY